MDNAFLQEQANKYLEKKCKAGQGKRQKVMEGPVLSRRYGRASPRCDIDLSPKENQEANHVTIWQEGPLRQRKKAGAKAKAWRLYEIAERSTCAERTQGKW